MRRAKIVPLILAAGEARALPFPKPLAPFERKTALQIALENCAGLEPPIVVLGCRAAEVRKAVPRGVRLVVNRAWRSGQLSSLRAGLRRGPQDAAFLLYPIDLPLLTRTVIRRLVRGFKDRQACQAIVAPTFRGRQGHPVILSHEMRRELARARTAKEIVKRDPRRLKLVPVGTIAIWQDFATLAAYQRCLREYRRRVRRG